MSHLVFVKLGGSLITDKRRAYTARPERIRALLASVAQALRAQPDLRVLLGHGSGSFGHWAAREHDVRTPEGLVAIARAAAQLHGVVMEQALAVGLRAYSFPPSALWLLEDGEPRVACLAALKHALAAGLTPVVYGDALLDRGQGGAILSTERVFDALLPELRPRRVLLVGEAPGVWADYPRNTRVLRELTPATWDAWRRAVRGSDAPDVTGGMASKVAAALAWVRRDPELEVFIFSGEDPATLRRALQGEPVGTWIHA